VLWDDEYIDEAGRRFVVRLTLQDALGHRTAEVYDFCRAHPGRIFPSFGRQRMAAPYSFSTQQQSPIPGRVFRGALRAVNVNTWHFKNEAAAALAVDVGDPGGVRLYKDFPHDYAAHLVAEYINDENAWECPPGRANHLWDCLVLSFAAAEIAGIRHRGRPRPAEIQEAARQHEQHEPPLTRRIRRAGRDGSWMGELER
jgi:phage terminase large subunit GpA-like protein